MKKILLLLLLSSSLQAMEERYVGEYASGVVETSYSGMNAARSFEMPRESYDEKEEFLEFSEKPIICDTELQEHTQWQSLPKELKHHILLLSAYQHENIKNLPLINKDWMVLVKDPAFVEAFVHDLVKTDLMRATDVYAKAIELEQKDLIATFIEAQIADDLIDAAGLPERNFQAALLKLNPRAAYKIFISSAQKGYAMAVQEFLNVHIEVNKPLGELAQTALMQAIAGGHQEVISLLINHHADVGIHDKLGRTPLMFAAIRGDSETIQLLISHRASIDCQDLWGDTALIWAAVKGHTEIVQLLIDSGANIEAQNRHGGTPLICAASNGHTEIVKLLIKCGADTHHITNVEEETALLCAVERGHLEITELLIDHGAHTNKGNNKNTALTRAIRSGNCQLVDLLIEHGLGVNAIDKDTGRTPLMFAARIGKKDIAELLINKRAYVNYTIRRSTTALTEAIEGGHTEIVRLLLEHRANINFEYNTEEMLARDSKFLFGYQAETDYEDHSLERLADNKGNADITKLLRDQRIKNLQNKKIDRAAHQEFFYAIAGGDIELVTLYINKGIDINMLYDLPEDHITGLMLASRTDQKEIVKLLLEHQANTNIQKKHRDTYTALMYAANRGNLEIVQMLIDKGADVNAKMEDGSTILDCAIQGNHREVAELLIKKGACVPENIDKNGSSCMIS